VTFETEDSQTVFEGRVFKVRQDWCTIRMVAGSNWISSSTTCGHDSTGGR